MSEDLNLKYLKGVIMSRALNIRYLDYVTFENKDMRYLNTEIYNESDLKHFVMKNIYLSSSENGYKNITLEGFANIDFNGEHKNKFYSVISKGYMDKVEASNHLISGLIASMEENNILFKENTDEDVHPSWTTEKIREFMKEGIPFDSNVKINFNPYIYSSNHYKFGDMEVIDMIRETLSIEQFKGFCMGNIIKYRMRAGKKEGSDDIAKAFKYEKYMEEKK